MTRYLKKQATSKKGINYIKSIIKQTGCSFHTIYQENDIGIDAIIELFQNGKSTGQLICIQVKSGDSFYNCGSRTCKIPIEKHRDYWANHNLPVFGIVYVPSLFCAYIVDIKKYLLQKKKTSSIVYPASELNLLDFQKFNDIIKDKYKLVVSYTSEFEKITNSNDFVHYRYLVNYGSISLCQLINAIMSSDNIDECLEYLKYKLVELKSNDIIEQKDISKTVIGPNSGKVIFKKNNIVFVEPKGFKLFHDTFLTFKTYLIDASLF